MAMNWILFQHGVPMPEFFERFGTEAQCRQELFELLWPGGFRCPECDVAEHRRGASAKWAELQLRPRRWHLAHTRARDSGYG